MPGIGDGGSTSSEVSGERDSESGEEGRRAGGGGDHWEDPVEHEEEEEQSEEYEQGVLFQERVVGGRNF